MLLGLKSIIPRRRATQASSALFLLLFAMPGISQKAQDSSNLPEYDTHTEMKTKGVVDEINVLPLGTKKELIELIIKSGSDKLRRPFRMRWASVSARVTRLLSRVQK